MQESSGYIKLYRKLVQWGWYKDNAVKCLFLHCLLTASFKEFKWMGNSMKAGQFVTSYKALSEILGFTVQQIRTALKKLESTKEIKVESTNKYTIITVLNWESYQAKTIENSANDNDCQIIEQQTKNALFGKQIMNSSKKSKNSTQSLTNKKDFESPLNSGIAECKTILSTRSATNEQQTNNKQITNKQQHNKNNKNNKNDKKRDINTHAHVRACEGTPTLSEISEFVCKENLIIDPEKFFYHYSAKEWNGIADWRSKAREWDIVEKKYRAEEKAEFGAYDLDLFEKMLNQKN